MDQVRLVIVNRKLFLGIISIAAFVVMLSMQGYLVKMLSLPIHIVLLGRFAAAFILLGLYLLFLHRLSTLARSYMRMKNWWTASIASALGCASVGCYFFSLHHLSLSVATTLFLSSPLFLPLVRKILLKDSVDNRVYLGIGIALLGILGILKDQQEIAILVALIAAALMAVWVVLWQRLHANHSSLNLSLHYFGIGALVALFLCWIVQGRTFFPIHLPEFYALVALGVVALGCQLFFTLALRYAPRRLALSWIYASLLVMIGMDEWLYRATISLTSILGMILLAIGSLGTMQIVVKGWKKNV